MRKTENFALDESIDRMEAELNQMKHEFLSASQELKQAHADAKKEQKELENKIKQILQATEVKNKDNKRLLNAFERQKAQKTKLNDQIKAIKESLANAGIKENEATISVFIFHLLNN